MVKIQRDITQLLHQSPAPIQVVLGPRQCGKSTLLASLSLSNNPSAQHTATYKEITFDDLQLRELANRDPALFLQQFEPPLLLDEVQYVPNLFPELKRHHPKRRYSKNVGIYYRATFMRRPHGARD
jgi:uncharacterized protein